MAVHVAYREDGLWYATFEISNQHEESETIMAIMLDVIETLPEPLRAVWLLTGDRA